VDREGSVKFQINEAKQDLIGTSGDQSSQDTINAAKNLVADSLQFIIYN
jgi:predicted polyphosphate/ATP-dependent NAD kinase